MDMASLFARLCGTYPNSLSSEAREFLGFIKKHLFNKVPSVSTLSGVAAGAIVSSAITSSPMRAMMTSVGVIDASAGVISPVAYRILSVSIPLFAAAATVYAVQKRLKSYRKKQLTEYRQKADRLDEGSRRALDMKLVLLEQARENGLVNDGEYESKLSGLYHSYIGKTLPRGVEEFIVKKLTS